jgi:probable addiction module antidote protein
MRTRKRDKATFSRYDAADYLKSKKDRVAYLEACMEEAGDDAAFIAHALGTIVRARGMAQLAKESGLTREGLHKVLNKERQPQLRHRAQGHACVGVEVHAADRLTALTMDGPRASR